VHGGVHDCWRIIVSRDVPMSADADSAIDNLAAFVQAIAGDPKLRERFGRLAQMSPTQRFNEIHIMAHSMAAGGEDAELIASLRLLADARVFGAAMAALRDCGCDLQ
jgi:hypothetical protein